MEGFSLVPAGKALLRIYEGQRERGGLVGNNSGIIIEVKLSHGTNIKLKNGELAGVTVPLFIIKDDQSKLNNSTQIDNTSQNILGEMSCSHSSLGYSRGSWNIRILLSETKFESIVDLIKRGQLPESIYFGGDNLTSPPDEFNLVEWDNIKYPKIRLQSAIIHFPLVPNDKQLDPKNMELATTIESIKKTLTQLTWIIFIFGILFLVRK